MYSDKALDTIARKSPEHKNLVDTIRNQRTQLKSIQDMGSYGAERALRDLQIQYDKVKAELAAYKSKYGEMT